MKGESARSRLTRYLFNLFPCYRRTGARVVFISPDFHEVRIKLPLTWKTRGYNGTLFGGSMYACVDPVYMTMISWNLGREYVAWDTAATIDFRKAGQESLNERLGDVSISEPVGPRMLMSVVTQCKLYDYDNHQWLDFDGNVTASIDFPKTVPLPVSAPKAA